MSQFPPDDDPPPPSGYITNRQWIAQYRDSLVVFLQQRATSVACDALRHIIRTRPELDWVRWQLQDAEKRRREHTWVPPKPEVILRLAGDNEARLVQNGEQLLDVLLESLERLQKELQGETSASIGLWNDWTFKIDEKNQTRYRPKDENELSNYIKRFLDRDIAQRGIVANREVELRRFMGGNRGERTDIHIDAFVRDEPRTPASVVTVIIEVKGCWNKDLSTAMETQLVDRYLKDSACRYGLYLVGWFNCKQWDSEDYRKGEAPKWSLDEARATFASQAMNLSADTDRSIVVKSFVLNTALR